MDDSGNRVSTTTVDAVLAVLYLKWPLTRAAIGVETGLSRPSVSAAVATLLDAGVVEEVTEASAGRGRPSRAIRLSTRRADAIGIELGRRHIAIAIADPTGAVVVDADADADPTSSLVSRARAALDLLESIAAARGIDLSAVRRVGVGTPGPRFAPAGSGASPRIAPLTSLTAFDVGRLERERADVADAVSERFGVPVEIGNNTRWTAVAEAHHRGTHVDLVYVRVDEGVGGGVVEHGEAATGAIGAAGEIGHVSVDPLGDRCPCGGRGCLELVASLPAVLHAAGVRDVPELLEHGDDDRVRAAVDRAAVATGGVIAGLLAVANPAVVAVGGAVADLPEFLSRLDQVARDASPDWATLDLVVERAGTDRVLGAVGAATAAAATLDVMVPLRRKDA
ncbi:ROK family protein [Curtobacterium sp. NPDC090217]|uniref:ROK family protein n=1 Tax=Curtobacterium sp. NPDC090217 TaxID=3363970 RepID=UPI0037FD6DE9